MESKEILKRVVDRYRETKCWVGEREKTHIQIERESGKREKGLRGVKRKPKIFPFFSLLHLLAVTIGILMVMMITTKGNSNRVQAKHRDYHCEEISFSVASHGTNNDYQKDTYALFQRTIPSVSLSFHTSISDVFFQLMAISH